MNSSGSSEQETHSNPRLLYLPALDGLRAIAVVGVLLYHAELPAFKGGFLGVDVFFVISGFLITSLLLGEWRETSAIDLRAFWLRRARRLLPALFVLLGVVLAYSVFFLPEEVARLRGDAGAAFGYVTNWYLIFNEQSYFQAAGRPSLFQHLWSLAVEEQFYVLWPVLLVLLLRFARRHTMAIVIAGAMASSLLMGALYSPEVDPSRVYYGTDTRAAGLLLGAALAFHLTRLSGFRVSSRVLDISREILCGLSLAAVAFFFVIVDESDPLLYQGGFLVIEIVVALLIATIALPGTGFIKSLLGSSVPRWIGLRSYGIYLWHWPVFMLTRPRVDVEIDGPALFMLRFGVTILLAELSYRLIETPIRQGALQRVWHAVRAPGPQRRHLFNARVAAMLATLVILVATLGPAIVSAKPPETPDYLSEESVNMVDPGANFRDEPIQQTELPASPTQTWAIRISTPTSTIELTPSPTATYIEERTAAPTAIRTATGTGTTTETIDVLPTSTVEAPAQATETATTSPPTITPTETAVQTATATTIVVEEPTLAPQSSATPPFLTDDDALYTPTIVPGDLTVNSPQPTPTANMTLEPSPIEPTPASPSFGPPEASATATIEPTSEPTSGATPNGTQVTGDVQSLGKVVAIGDSVMLGAVKELTRVIPNMVIDAKVSRQESAAISLLASYKNSGLLGDVVVIHIGNNGSVTTKQFDQIMGILTDTKWVVFVNLSVPRKWEEPNNAVLAEGVARYPNTILVDWHGASVNHRDYFASDGYHLQVKGQGVYADMILEALRKLTLP